MLDYIEPSVRDATPKSYGVLFALKGDFALSDNHGNVLMGHDLIGHDQDVLREYHLSDEQLASLARKIMHYVPPPRSEDEGAHDKKIFLPDGVKSPLEITLDELEKQGAPWTPISKAERDDIVKMGL